MRLCGRSCRVKQEIGAADPMARLQKTLDHEVEVLEHQCSGLQDRGTGYVEPNVAIGPRPFAVYPHGPFARGAPLHGPRGAVARNGA